MKPIAGVASSQTWWQKFNAWVIAFEAAMDFRETDILSDRTEYLKQRMSDIEAQLHNLNDCGSGSINPNIASEVSYD